MSDTYVKQYGGTHYESDYPHWDWVTDIGMGYLPGNATKYVARWRKKNGEADLRKAMTYVDKMLAVLKVKPGYQFNRPASYTTRVCTDRFVEVNGLVGAERSFMELLSGPCPEEMLVLAHDHLRSLIATAQRAAERAAGAGGMVAPAAPSRPLLDQKTGGPGRAGRATTQAPASSASTEVASMPSVVGSGNPEAHDYLAGMENRGKIDHPSPFGYEEDDG